MEPVEQERNFSIELKSKAQLRNVNLSNGPSDTVLLEGTLGKLAEATFAEGEILEVLGTKGSLRINLHEEEIKKQFHLSKRRIKNENNKRHST